MATHRSRGFAGQQFKSHSQRRPSLFLQLGLELGDPVRYDDDLGVGAPRPQRDDGAVRRHVVVCVRTGEHQVASRNCDLCADGQARSHEPVGILVHDGVRVLLPARIAPAIRRHLHMRATGRKRTDVDLVVSALVGNVRQPASVGRDRRAGLVEPGVFERLRLTVALRPCRAAGWARMQCGRSR